MTVTEAARLLKLRLPVTEPQIKKAYHKFARRWHPDLHPGNPASPSLMVAVNEAAQVLLRFAATRVKASTKEKKARDRASVRTDPPATYRVVWSGPLKAVSDFWESRGFTVRPTDGRVTFRIMKDGRQRFTLEHHPDDPQLLVCRNERGEFVTIDGVTFWIDDGISIIPYAEGSV